MGGSVGNLSFVIGSPHVSNDSFENIEHRRIMKVLGQTQNMFSGPTRSQNGFLKHLCRRGQGLGSEGRGKVTTNMEGGTNSLHLSLFSIIDDPP